MDEFRIERELNHTYMVLSEWQGEEDYRHRMLRENKVPGILPIQKRVINAIAEEYVDITGLQSMEDLFMHRDLQRADVKKLYEAIHNIADVAAEYLIDESDIILSPKNIFFDIGKEAYRFICAPSLADREGNDIKDLLLFMMQHMDSDELLVKTVYSAYGYAETSRIGFASLHKMLEDNTPEEEEVKEEDETEIAYKPETYKYVPSFYVPSFREVVALLMLGIGIGLIGYDIYLSMLI